MNPNLFNSFALLFIATTLPGLTLLAQDNPHQDAASDQPVLLLAQGKGKAQGKGRGRQDPDFAADRAGFQFLLANHDEIRREVKHLDNGVETVTESDDAEIAKKIQEHVAAMHKRVTKPNPIHLRDPLFAALFRHTDKIEMKIENTEKGVRVTEISDDPQVVPLIQAHAAVVSLFVKNGSAEARKNHEVPR